MFILHVQMIFDANMEHFKCVLRMCEGALRCGGLSSSVFLKVWVKTHLVVREKVAAIFESAFFL